MHKYNNYFSILQSQLCHNTSFEASVEEVLLLTHLYKINTLGEKILSKNSENQKLKRTHSIVKIKNHLDVLNYRAKVEFTIKPIPRSEF